MGKKNQEQQKRNIVIGLVVVAVVLIGLILLIDRSRDSRLLSAGLTLDRLERDKTGLTAYHWFFRGSGSGSADVREVQDLISRIGDGELPANLTPEELANIQRILAKSRTSTFARLAPMDLVEAARRMLDEIVGQCSLT